MEDFEFIEQVEKTINDEIKSGKLELENASTRAMQLLGISVDVPFSEKKENDDSMYIVIWL